MKLMGWPAFFKRTTILATFATNKGITYHTRIFIQLLFLDASFLGVSLAVSVEPFLSEIMAIVTGVAAGIFRSKSRTFDHQFLGVFRHSA
mmetsp:Transcript_20607/g.31446  ORF Transcript_20607/g.31446 Transcript_20607/m.31446 type:complete len:90 (-) Transcript_20607:68-337(-)